MPGPVARQRSAVLALGPCKAYATFSLPRGSRLVAVGEDRADRLGEVDVQVCAVTTAGLAFVVSLIALTFAFGAVFDNRALGFGPAIAAAAGVAAAGYFDAGGRR